MSTKTTKRGPNMHRITEDMKQWSAMLENELRSWLHVTTRPMFGLLGYYRKKTIFAALPGTRAIGAPHAIIVKFQSIPPDCPQGGGRSCRVAIVSQVGSRGWFSFDINSAEDLRKALLSFRE